MELLLTQYHPFMDKIPLFRHIKNHSIKVFMFGLLKPSFADVGKLLLREGSQANEMIFFTSGKAVVCRVVKDGFAKRKSMKTLKSTKTMINVLKVC
jgi:hypothetical protein